MITRAAVSGYVSGYPDGTFRAEIPVDRGSLSAILYRYAGSPPVPPNAPTFADVPPGSENDDAIRWIASWGIDEGYADGTFRPAQEITRRTLAVFLHRLADRPPVPADAPIYSSYTDIQPGIPTYEELAWVAPTFVIVGNPDGSFGPDQLIERGAMVRSLFFYRFSFNFPVMGRPRPRLSLMFRPTASSPMRSPTCVRKAWSPDGTTEPSARSNRSTVTPSPRSSTGSKVIRP